MAVVYRALFSDDREGLLDAVESLWAGWLRDKGVDVAQPEEGEVTHNHYRLRTGRGSNGDCSALRFVLGEEQPGSYWTTTLTGMVRGSEQWVWLDVEMVRDEVFGRPPDVRSPLIVRRIIANGSARMGTAKLKDTPFDAVTSGHADFLVRTLFDPRREAPLVVFSPRFGEPETALAARVERTAARLAGVANTWRLSADAAARLSAVLGRDLHVYGGAVRTYLPGVDSDDPLPWRHRYVRWERLQRHADAAAAIVGQALLTRATARRPPELYRNVVRHLPGFRFPREGDVDALLADLYAEEQAHEATAALLREADEARELAGLELEEGTRELAKARDRVRWLEGELAKHGRHVWGEEPEQEVPSTADGCAHAIDLARTFLNGVVIPQGVETEAADLDGYEKAGTWGQRAWDAFRALDCYAASKADGVSGDFQTLLSNGRLSYAIPTRWWTPHESSTTENNPDYRAARTLPVAADVDSSGRVYMPAHVKIEPGGRPAPRIHVYDDTTGPTGKVHVGYFGAHLRNQQTN